MIIEFNSFTKKLTEEKNDVFFRSLLCVAKHCSHGKKFYQIKDFTKKKKQDYFLSIINIIMFVGKTMT